jgi:guanylate kinase
MNTLPMGLIAITGASGAGKSTLRHALIEAEPTFVPVVSSTTRAPRAGEAAVTSYRFLSAFEFAARLDQGRMVEYDEFAGHCYGLEHDAVKGVLARPWQVGVVVVTAPALEPLRALCAAYGRRLFAVHLEAEPALVLERLFLRFRDEPSERAAQYARRAVLVIDGHAAARSVFDYDLVVPVGDRPVADAVATIRRAVRPISGYERRAVGAPVH